MELSQFLQGFFETAIAPDELLTDVLVPLDPAVRCRYTRFNAGSEDDYPTVTVAVSWRLRGDGAVTAARVAVGGAAPTVHLAAEAATLLEGAVPSPDLIARVAASTAAGCSPSGDSKSSAGYKRAMVEVWVQRALTGLAESATRG
jgi:carbon-monoxide dehydrogenase medium subunit